MSQTSRRPLLLIGISAGLILVLAGIIYFAAFAPPSPERVTAAFMDALVSQDFEKISQVSMSPARNQLSAVAGNRDAESKWYDWWQNSSQYFVDYRFTQTVVDGDTAIVSILYGPGLFLEMDIHLKKGSSGWRVTDAN